MNSYEIFENIFLTLLNKHAPCKAEDIRDHRVADMSTNLEKAKWQ